MSGHALSYSGWTYDKLEQEFKKFEYGVPAYDEIYWHKKGEIYVASWWGRGFVELHPDDSVYVVMHEHWSNGNTTRLDRLTGKDFVTRRKPRANGMLQYELTCIKFGRATSYGRFLLHSNGAVEAADLAEPVAAKDNEKYRTFNAKLKKLKAALLAQIKMGTYKDIEAWLEVGIKDTDYTDACDTLQKDVMNYIERPDSTQLKRLALLCFRTHDSNKYDRIENQVRRVINALTWVQKRYLQQHCVTISDSNVPLRSLNDDNPIGQLLPPPGLREVQVSGEAQVC